MAIWQFNIAFVPAGAPRPSIHEDGYELDCLSVEDTGAALKSLEARFGSGRTVLPGWVQFGAEKGHRFDASLEGERAELSARVDARSPDEMLAFVCSLASHLRCTLFIPESSELLVPDAAGLLSAYQRSKAFQFVRSPSEFLRTLADAS